MNKTTFIWIILFLLSSFTLFLGGNKTFTSLLILLVLSTTFLKGQFVIDYFMGLKEVKLGYRLIVTLWLFLVTSLIALAFIIPVE